MKNSIMLGFALGTLVGALVMDRCGDKVCSLYRKGKKAVTDKLNELEEYASNDN